MSSLTINSIKMASRCEICHQCDCFDAINNICYRCIDLPEDYLERISSPTSYSQIIDLGTAFGAIIGSLLGLIIDLLQGRSFLQLSTYLMIFGLMSIGALWGTMIVSGIRR